MYNISSTRSPSLAKKRTVSDIAFHPSRNTALSYYLQRTLDIALVVCALPVILPLTIIAALAIKLDSAGPILFTQKRVCARRQRKDGRIVWEAHNFSFYKFRSMVPNADQSLHQAYIKAFVHGDIAASEDTDAQFKLDHDPRITRVGHWLRKTSLDELPQLFNVLKGEMSLVGPRPVPTYEVAEYEPQHYERFTALSGLTGLWQIYGRGQVTFEEMMELDLIYVRNQSLWLYLKILFLTIPAVLAAKGAK